MRLVRTTVLLALSVAPVAACVNGVEDSPGVSVIEKDGAQKNDAEQWASNDSPTLFSDQLKYALADLPKTGEAAVIPWASSYWPTYKDSINYKWDGAASDAATTKYGKAFNVAGVEDAVSGFRGIDADKTRTTCKQSSECKADIGEECALRDGKTDGRCVPTWFGICHAWAPASILVPEPKHAVTKNGVVFKVNDIKALITLAHDGVVNKFVSLRCEKDDRPGAKNIVEYDENGRPKDPACRDSNAGSFHVLLTNYLGVQRASFVFDQTFDDEVWNQPLRSYSVVDQHEVTIGQANALLAVSGPGAVTKTLTATVALGATQNFDAVDVQPSGVFKAVMTGTGDADLYVKLGSAPTTTTFDCRPYTDGSSESCEVPVPAGVTKAFVSVNGYTAASVSVVVTAGPPPPSTYIFDALAKKLVYTKTDVKYIGESSPETDGPLASSIDQYTSTNTYEYILELDAADKIIGGEWVGASKRFHPDFAWLPVRVRNETIAGKLRYADIKALADASVVDDTTTTTAKTEHDAGTAVKGDMKTFGPFHVGSGALSAVMTGTGDADLYVRKGAAPSLSLFDCRPYKNGSAESCTVNGPGDIYVSVNGYAATSTFDLVLTWTEGGATTPTTPLPPLTTTHLSTSGTLAVGAWAYFTVNVVAGKPIVVRTIAPHDVDVYLQMGVDPTADNNVAQAFTSSGNETLQMVPTVSGVLHIGVNGYEASTFTLTTADN